MTATLQRALRHPRVEPWVATALRGKLVRESTRFTLRERKAANSVGVYRVRANGLRVQIAHHTPDVLTLDQAFYQHVYEPPPAVVALLERGRQPLSAVDLGANIGIWGLWLHGRFPVERVVALEPDPENAGKHRRQIELNRLDRSWQLLQAAATLADGPVVFSTGQATTGRIAEQGERGAVEVQGRDSFSLLDGVDLLKVDIEGAEWPLLADPRLASISVPVVMLEYHPHGAPSADPREDAQRALAGAGYQTLPMHDAPDGTGIVWGWRPES
ncbi:MAG TPA: FkbM family methyltransferase [Solirubrobacteraceae bacterium]|nr:FkbM family methyltransferase [Solirubrobacteraceae bacterium]